LFTINQIQRRIRTVDLLITNQEGLKSVRLAMNRASWATLSSWFLDFCDGDCDREG
jgi:hypothetical protein